MIRTGAAVLCAAGLASATPQVPTKTLNLFGQDVVLPALEAAAAGGGAERRQLQAACGGLMMEMGSVASNCCGNNMEYCAGPVPSTCDSTCAPIWESFFTRCNNLVQADPHRAEYLQFQQLCHPAGTDTSNTLFHDDFESGLGKWRGPSGDAPTTAIIADGGHGHGSVLEVQSCAWGGDAFSTAAFACSIDQPCLVSYKIKGRAWQGFSSGFPENHVWTATPTDYEGSMVITQHDIDHWHDVEYVFPVQKADGSGGNFVHGDYTSAISSVHFMLEGNDFDCAGTQFDDISIKRYTGSAEQSAAVNAAVHPANILFSDNFDGGINKWKGKGENPRPESAIITEDHTDFGHGNVMLIQSCGSGGDAYTVDTMDCTLANKCKVSFYAKGQPWQGFAVGYPGSTPYIWTATGHAYIGAGYESTVQTQIDTGNWRHVEYVWPVDAASEAESNFDAASTSGIHMMFEIFNNGEGWTDLGQTNGVIGGASNGDGDCIPTYVDDIVVTRFTGSSEAAAGINSHANAGLDMLYHESFETGIVGQPPHNWEGRAGPGSSPETAVIAEDPTHGKVLQMQSCVSGGDAFASQMVMCTRAFPCSVSFMMKGGLYQGFADGYPGAHTWSATPGTGYMAGQGVAAQTLNQPDWHLVEYTFPMAASTGTHVHDCTVTPCQNGAGVTAPIEMVHFMVEGSGGDCTTSFIDNIVIRRYRRNSNQAFCTAGNSRVCELRNDLVPGQDEGGTARTEGWDMCGTKSVQDTGATKESDCQGFCDRETDFNCAGFGYRQSDHTCHLYADASNCAAAPGTPNDSLNWYTCRSKPCPTQSTLPGSLVGYWPLDGSGADISGHGLAATDQNGEYTAGLYGQAFRFSGDDLLTVPDSISPGVFDLTHVTMMAWVRPTTYDLTDDQDRAIIMNREGSYEFGLEVSTGALQGAFFSGCWRWFGNVRIPMHEWTHTAMAYDGASQLSYVSGTAVENDACPGGDLVPMDISEGGVMGAQTFEGFSIGSRGAQSGLSEGGQEGASQFRGDLDEAMLFSEALSQPQIFAIYHRAYDANSGGSGVTFVRAPSTVNMAEVPTGLVGFWPLDGDARDQGPNRLTGTATNPDWVAGQFNLAFRFNGDDSVVITNTAILSSLAGGVTISAWVRPVAYDVCSASSMRPNSPDVCDRGVIMNKEGAFEVGIEDQTGALQAAFSSCWRWFGETRIPAHEFTHIAVSAGNNVESHYVAGQLGETDPCAGSITPNEAPLILGARSFDGHLTTSNFLGDIDEVMLFSRVLSAATIDTLYQTHYRTGGGMTNVYAAGSPNPAALPAGAVGFWPLDGDGTDLVGGNYLRGTGEEWVKALFGLGYRFDGQDVLRASACNIASSTQGDGIRGHTQDTWALDLTEIMMVAWVRPVSYDVTYGNDRGVIVNKEGSYELGLQDNTGALQGAFSPCWRWFGTRIIPAHEWTHIGVGYDGATQVHFIDGEVVENDPCGAGGPLAITTADFRVGHREAVVGYGHSVFTGDIDEIIIFDHVLSEADLTSVYTAQYRSEAVSDAVALRNSHSLENNAPLTAHGSRSVVRPPIPARLTHIPSLIGFWPLDGDCTDASSNGLDGTVSNAEWVVGVHGQGLHYSGNDDVIIPAALLGTVTIAQVTMMAWVRPDANGHTSAQFEGDHGIILNKEFAYEMGIQSGSGNLQAAFQAGSLSDPTNPQSGTSGCWRWWGNVIIPVHEWTHVAISYDGNTEHHYVGAAQVEEQPCGTGGALLTNDEDLRIGSRGHAWGDAMHGHGGSGGLMSANSAFIGDIDEVMLYGAALNAEQIEYAHGLQYYGSKSRAPSSYVAITGDIDATHLPHGIIGFWPLDRSGDDASGVSPTLPAAHWNQAAGEQQERYVAGKFSFALNIDGADGMVIPDVDGALEGLANALTMSAWVRPVAYDVCSDRGIIMSKESHFEMGVEADVGALQAAGGGCWRWWGNTRLNLYEWSMAAVSFDGSHQTHSIDAVEVENTECAWDASVRGPQSGFGAAGGLPDSALRIGARAGAAAQTAGVWSQFQGDIDEAMIFNKKLSVKDLENIYHGGYRPGTTDLDTSGTTIDTSHLAQVGLLGFWPLEGDGSDVGTVGTQSCQNRGHCADLTATNARFVVGLFGEAFQFDGDDMLEAAFDPALDADFITMLAWVRPLAYDVSADHGIIMNKENSYEMALEDSTGYLQGAFQSGTYTGGQENGLCTSIRTCDYHYNAGSTGCWRWWGTVRIPLHEWTHVGVQFDGSLERHFVNGEQAEYGSCPGDPTASPVGALNKNPQNRLRIGARGAAVCPEGDTDISNCVAAAPSSTFRGDIDEVMLFGQPISTEDVHYVFSAAYRSGSSHGGGH